jgi:hypothetical protein
VAEAKHYKTFLPKKKKHSVDVRKKKRLMDILIDRAKIDPENWTCLATD